MAPGGEGHGARNSAAGTVAWVEGISCAGDSKNISKITGELAERPKAAVLKTVEEKSSGGSNPSLSAIIVDNGKAPG